MSSAMVAAPGPAAAVDLITRRANVIVTVRLTTTRPGVDARATVTWITRSVLSRIAFG